ncbi:uncharacterized protein LOC129592423 isoform X2 [Paramacrobiotus metropolitanus]|nr:uncharacterized protein LOC129592423 isoform X2 [Paramacrobiotus metropolitanus]
MDAMADLERKTCIRFLPRTHEEDYLKISPGKACASDVGYRKGQHLLSVNPGCLDDLGAIQHEILHALGFIHEQSRLDRDEYVFINFKNVKPDPVSQAQFYIFKNPEITDLGIPYDYLSVMHYPMNAFAIDRDHPSIVPRQKDKYIGNRVELSPLDIRRLNRLYRCDDNPLDEKRNSIPRAAAETYTRTFKDWTKLCDLNKDTPEAWDEDADVCIKMCRKLDTRAMGPDGDNLFNRAASKQCMHKRQLCAGQWDASYEKMEQPGYCRKYCRLGGYVAMPGSAQCVHYSKLCNGKSDTNSGEDEDQQICQDLCQSESSGFAGQLFSSEEAGMRCFKKEWLCDGQHSGPMGDPDYCVKYCKGGGYFPVGDEKRCLHWRKLCDGYKDTVSGDDESPAVCQAICALASDEASGQLFQLPSGQCVDKRWLCDGAQHDSADLMENMTFCREQCQGNGFITTTNSAQCLHVTDLCDGKFDTRNGWDESVINCQNFCQNTKDWPPQGVRLETEAKTNRCVLVDGPRRRRKGGRKKSQIVGDDTGSALFDITLGGQVSDNNILLQGMSNFAANQTNETIPGLRSPPSTSLDFVFGNATPHQVAGTANQWEITIPHKTHLLLTCSGEDVMTVESAMYTAEGGAQNCPALSNKRGVARKCDQLPACGFIARDPSKVEGCRERSLIVRYSCGAPVEVFRTDPTADKLCNQNSTDDADETVQCNMSAISLIP